MQLKFICRIKWKFELIIFFSYASEKEANL